MQQKKIIHSYKLINNVEKNHSYTIIGMRKDFNNKIWSIFGYQESNEQNDLTTIGVSFSKKEFKGKLINKTIK